MCKEYSETINQIKDLISNFNEILNYGKFDLSNLKIMNLPELTTDEKWPNADSSGVYFMLGHLANDMNRKSVYIGKASNKSSIGCRVSRHLGNKLGLSKIYKYDDYHIEYVVTIPTSKGFKYLAPALEEYIIGNIEGSMNVVGKNVN